MSDDESRAARGGTPRQSLTAAERISPKIEERLSALEARVESLETQGQGPADPSTFWALDTLRQQPSHSGAGAVVFAGEAQVSGNTYAYQWQRPTETLVAAKTWDENFARLLALAHPVRGAILRRLLYSPSHVAELVEEDLVPSASTAYHHMAELTHAGWIQKTSSSRYEIAPRRVIPLLAIISASDDH